MPRLDKGLVEVYTGNGKGKTTAAFGLALRAAGHGLKVLIVQFMKGWEGYGEVEACKKIENIEVVRFGTPEFVNPASPKPIDIEEARRALEYAREAVLSGKYDIVVLDEVNVALHFKLIELGDILDLIEKKPSHVELVLTGRYAPPELVKAADLVTVMEEVKHPFRQGVVSRRGIDY
ncbi:MAG: cob(I)yrinic acid a,c-diamide adenosyltransferase [Thermoproteota archaeon]|nr:MAG: cob(I)yrinic acid a,c-diamide adenosyltransferase [Candidatus Korarchaeota archaeon]